MQNMNAYDAKAWEDIQRRKSKPPGRRRVRDAVPSTVKDRGSRAASSARVTLQSAPGADRFQEVFLNSLGGLIDLTSRLAAASVRDQAIVRSYAKAGHDVTVLEDIQKLSLLEIDRIRPKHLDLGYLLAAGAEGAGAGFAVSGGELAAAGGGVFGAGAAAAPGAAVVVGAMAADAAALVVASQRAVAHVAAYYGYDVSRTDEALYALGVMGVGTASEAGKVYAYAELNKLVQSLARKKSWEELNKNVATQVVTRVYQMLGFKLAKRKLGQAVPVLGIVIGAGLNIRLLSEVVNSANLVYRERFLIEKYGLVNEVSDVDVEDVEDVVAVTEILDEEVAGIEVLDAIVVNEDNRPRL
jgi:hypothetical protein